ncbi:iron ABC transporter permease [Asinibacterium sp. OR53]|uniref:FecCD family ABC transporter permease n=1 Tax=Asinibacterium sp. OR53 TaxID=925409 RepID=UPI00047B80E0|nr:iron ABC transporter permease [Asinibacterium sp. OR53]
MQKLNKKSNFFILYLLLAIVFFEAAASGAVSISFHDMLAAFRHWITNSQFQHIEENVFIQIRLPRVLQVMLTGMVLSVSGVLMQGLFRNPIVEPGLVGTSAGAAFGASLVFVAGDLISIPVKNALGPMLVPFAAFIGALAASMAVYYLARKTHHLSIISLLLIGIAINAVGLSATGFMSYLARDPQARSITFWSLGNFSGATWTQVGITAVVSMICLAFSFRLTNQLNILMLGEDNAAYTGVDLERLKKKVLLINAVVIAVVTAFAGVISFVGLITPHIMRLLIGSNNKILLPASMLGGAILLTLADLAARSLLVPAEIPVGIITSLIGAPVFIFLLKKMNLFNA